MILDLPDDMLVHTGMLLLDSSDLTSVARLRASCPALRTTLEPVHEAVASRRLHWERGHLSYDGRTLFPNSATGNAWAVGKALPTTGRSSFIVRMRYPASAAERLRSVQSDPLPRRLVGALRRRQAPTAAVPRADVFVGVAEATGCAHVWALHISSGRFVRYTREEQPRGGGGASVVVRALGGAAPDGWPSSGHGRQLLLPRRHEEEDATNDPMRRINTVEVIVDHAEGTLIMRVDGGAELLALSGLPQGASLRPCCELVHAADLAATLEGLI